MKNRLGQVRSGLVVPPDVTPREDVIESPATAHAGDPARLRPHPAASHDKRPEIAAHTALLRLAARQVEPRTAVDCHVRTRRRPRTEPGTPEG